MVYSLFVAPIVSYMLNKLGDLMFLRFSEYQELSQDIQSLETSLRTMEDVLKIAGSGFPLLDNDEQWMTCMSAITDILLEAEDALDTFLHIANERDGSTPFLLEYWNLRKEKFRKKTKLINKVMTIKKRLHETITQRKLFELLKPGFKDSEERYQRLCFIREKESKREDRGIFGFQVEKERIQTLVNSDEEKRLVISVVGMGGSGKTVLAHQLYHAENQNKVNSSFGVLAWVNVAKTISNNNDAQRIKLLKEISRDTELSCCDDNELETKIPEFLRGRKYMIVLDDVWDTDTLKTVIIYFPENNNGSRLLITTRSMHVAKFTSLEDHIVKLNALSEHDSLELLLHEMNAPASDRKKLEERCKPMLRFCYGLPLAILELAEILVVRKQIHWGQVTKNGCNGQNVIKGIIWKSNDNRSACLDILCLSYNELKPEQKACLLYLSAFRKDSAIDKAKLIMLWEAEDFIEADKSAESYLEDFVSRNMVEIETADFVNIHGVLFDLYIQKAEQLHFLHICDGGNHGKKPNKVRRIALHEAKGILNHLDRDNVMRTLLCFVPCGLGKMRLDLLRILDIPSEKMNDVLKTVDRLVYLRYLGLNGDGSLTSRNLDEKCKFWRKLQTSHLQYLRTVCLKGITGIEQVKFSKNSFSQLEVLILESLDSFQRLCIEDGAMNNLIRLQLKSCPSLTDFSVHQKAMENLKDLLVDDYLLLKIPAGLSQRQQEGLNIRVS